MKPLLHIGMLFFLPALPLTAQGTVAGDWMATFHNEFGVASLRMTLTVSGDQVTGNVGMRKVEGTFRGSILELKADNQTVKATLVGDELTGEVALPDRTVKWTARRIPSRPAAPRTHDFEPKEFHQYFSSAISPALRIHAGDTVRTWSVDAGGRDKAGTQRSGGGNPQTGPFYIEQAAPGDTLVVRLTKIRTNRSWAGSGTSIMRTALEPSTLGDLKWVPGFPNRWTIDSIKGVAFLEKPTDALKGFVVPLQPMLGCVAVAPPEKSSVRTTDSGRFGGNMDYNQIREGVTVYLPVYHPGALLFVGDGHAAQGDGELTGDALETSMDIEFTVDVIPSQSIGHPLVENQDFLISVGIGGSLDQALQQATSGLVRWLERGYKLNPNEASMVLGFAGKYDVVDLVGTQVSIAAKVPKSALAGLRKPQP